MSHDATLVSEGDNPTPITLVKTDTFGDWRSSLDDASNDWLARQNFSAEPGQFAFLAPATASQQVIVGWDGLDNLATLGGLPQQLPPGDYILAQDVIEQHQISALQLAGWGMGAYQFTRYKKAARAPSRLVVPEDATSGRARQIVLAMGLARDLINTPAADMAPSHIAAEVQALADMFDAEVDVTIGDALLDLECGAIHAVGRAAEDPPCLIDLSWGAADAPKVTLVGKGVTFDSGGLNIKPASGMRLMKKDMGGAATAIGLARLIMSAGLPVRLRLLVPAAENAIAGNAFRPGDVLHTRKGLTVEIDNTDAEGRLLLCDALALAAEDKPDVIADFATLTGSARSAVGAEIAAMFCNDDALAAAVEQSGRAANDAVWRMPLHKGYRHMLESKVADLVNSAASPYAGAVTAALFLEYFVGDCAWLHFDIMAFNTRNRPAHPEGGEAMALRAVFDYLEGRYGAA